MRNKIKVSEATGPVLDYLVAKCEGYNPFVVDKNAAYYSPDHGSLVYALFSTNWSQGGPIIEREGINTFKHNKLDASEHDKWGAHKVVPRKAMDGVEYSAALCLDGPTPLIAAMRCYVASKLGDEVEIPEELM